MTESVLASTISIRENPLLFKFVPASRDYGHP